MDRRGKWTPSSLRKHYQFTVSRLPGRDRQAFAYDVLSQICLDDESGSWTAAQRRAVALGLKLGMNEGIR